jgi:A/G-specific adenine glycosylase
VAALAKADFDEVATLWAGLGYYARARNLHKAAIEIMTSFAGLFPDRVDQLETLPGIGRSTAAAIAVFAFATKATILDGNVKRILTRYFAISDEIDSSETTQQLWALAETLLPDDDINHYIQGLMDLGSLVCKRNRPTCQICPIHQDCMAYIAGNPQSYPVRKQAKAKPIRAAIFLIHQSPDQSILLEKRPNKGIWGGLWCFPSIEIDPSKTFAEIQEIASKHLDCETDRLSFLPSFQHIFTHFNLQIYPVLCQNFISNAPLSADQQWHRAEKMDYIGAPKPVLDLLSQLYHNNNKVCGKFLWRTRISS